jgi:hypothetical protein
VKTTEGEVEEEVVEVEEAEGCLMNAVGRRGSFWLLEEPGVVVVGGGGGGRGGMSLVVPVVVWDYCGL